MLFVNLFSFISSVLTDELFVVQDSYFREQLRNMSWWALTELTSNKKKAGRNENL